MNYTQPKTETIRTIIAIDGTGTPTGLMGLAINAILMTLKDTISKTE
jgi:hypothetical protein